MTAQKLRYVDLLIATPVELALAPESEIPVYGNATVLLAHPACFIAQKLLIASSRIPAKQAQDTLYVHDTLELFSGSIEAFKAHWNNQVRPLLHARTLSKLWSEVGKQYGNTTDIHRRSVLIPQDRVLDPERLRAVCKLGLERLFDPCQSAPILA